jgi:hypothetical protein
VLVADRKRQTGCASPHGVLVSCPPSISIGGKLGGSAALTSIDAHVIGAHVIEDAAGLPTISFKARLSVRRSQNVRGRRTARCWGLRNDRAVDRPDQNAGDPMRQTAVTGQAG